MVSVLCVCTFNRTRSVIAASLLEHHVRSFGVDATIRSAGTRASGGLATSEATKLLGDRGLDVRGHRGTPLDDDLVGTADLIIAAEQDHVVTIATRWPGSFSRCFTLPEVCTLAARSGGRLGGPLDDWLALLGAGRPSGVAYLDDSTIGEIADPTGHDRRTWTQVFTQIDHLTQQLAKALT